MNSYTKEILEYLKNKYIVYQALDEDFFLNYNPSKEHIDDYETIVGDIFNTSCIFTCDNVNNNRHHNTFWGMIDGDRMLLLVQQIISKTDNKVLFLNFQKSYSYLHKEKQNIEKQCEYFTILYNSIEILSEIIQIYKKQKIEQLNNKSETPQSWNQLVIQTIQKLSHIKNIKGNNKEAVGHFIALL